MSWFWVVCASVPQFYVGTWLNVAVGGLICVLNWNIHSLCRGWSNTLWMLVWMTLSVWDLLIRKKITIHIFWKLFKSQELVCWVGTDQTARVSLWSQFYLFIFFIQVRTLAEPFEAEIYEDQTLKNMKWNLVLIIYFAKTNHFERWVVIILKLSEQSSNLASWAYVV
jgi:hypothetical protein